MGAARMSFFFFKFLQSSHSAQKQTQKAGDCKSANSFQLHRGRKGGTRRRRKRRRRVVYLKSATEVNPIVLRGGKRAFLLLLLKSCIEHSAANMASAV